MLPVVAGAETTRQHILAYTLALLLVSLLPWGAGFAGNLYGLAALGLGFGFVRHAVRLWRERSERAAMRTFRYSIVYLFGLLLALVVDKALRLGGLGLVTTSEEQRRRRAKSIAIALILAGLAALFYLITIVKMSGAGA